MELFLSIFTALFSVINPLGTVPIMSSLTKDFTKSERNKTSFSTALNVLVILLSSYFLGQFILSFFGISINSLRIGGGLIISASGFALLTGKFSKHKGMEKNEVETDVLERKEISLTPLAIPMLAGPGSISLLISMNSSVKNNIDYLITVAAILAVCIVIYFTLKSSIFISTILGGSGINAVSRIIGMILIAIGIEYITKSILELIHLNFNI
jgi:multiple antibiotic resistance protein